MCTQPWKSTVQQHTAAPAGVKERPVSILPLSASTDAALVALAAKYITFANDPKSGDPTPSGEDTLENICFTAATGRQHFSSRLALPCSTLQEMVSGLGDFVDSDRKSTAKASVGKVEGNTDVVMLFTGQGSQVAGMGRELYDTYPAFKDSIDNCAKLLKNHMDKDLLTVLFPKAGDEELINATAYTQPALFAFEYSMAQLLMSWGVEAAAVCGHSVGEYVAACVAGVFSLEDGLKLIAARAKLMDSVPREGSMAAVFASRDEVEEAIKQYNGRVSVATVNGPKMIVISGFKPEVAKAVASFKAKKTRCVGLNTSNAFHSAVMEPILDKFEKIASGITYGEPFTPLVLNRTAKICDASSIPDAAYWRDHLRNAVLYSDSIETLHAAGYKLFVEVGPSPVLIGMARRIVDDPTVKWIPAMAKPTVQEASAVSKCVSDLYVSGASVNWKKIDEPYARSRLLLPPYAFQQKSLWPRRMEIGQEMIANPGAAITGAAVPSAGAKSNAADDTMFDVSWRALGDATPADREDSGAWLILADQGGLGEALAKHALTSGRKCILLHTRDTKPLVEADMMKAVAQKASGWGQLLSCGRPVESRLSFCRIGVSLGHRVDCTQWLWPRIAPGEGASESSSEPIDLVCDTGWPASITRPC
jgi:acyl transferase domain-containing protein